MYFSKQKTDDKSAFGVCQGKIKFNREKVDGKVCTLKQKKRKDDDSRDFKHYKRSKELRIQGRKG